MAKRQQQRSDLSGSLEDYLKAIYDLAKRQRFARVKDIAKVEGVKASSVTPALKRLSELGLVDYVQREYVGLTAKGEEQARRVLAKQRLLLRFFSEVLRLPQAEAEEQACAIEHSLSAGAMDRLVRFFEFLGTCPKAAPGLLELFVACPLVDREAQPGAPGDVRGSICERGCVAPPGEPRAAQAAESNLADVSQGRTVKVVRIVAPDTIRQRLIHLGFLPGTVVTLERLDVDGESQWIRIEGGSVRLRAGEARALRVVAA